MIARTVLVVLGGLALAARAPAQPPGATIDPKELAAAPEKFLRHTTARQLGCGPPGRENEPIVRFLKEHPADPLARVMASDRAVITRLIPLLTDETPVWTRPYIGLRSSETGPPVVVRVGDVALAAIEYHSKCQFSGGGHAEDYIVFARGAEARRELARTVANWWRQAEKHSVARGIGMALPVVPYESVPVMAKRMHRLGTAADKDHALAFLIERVRQNPRNNVTAGPAFALAELGDLTPLDIIAEAWEAVPPDGLICDLHIVAYLCAHGRRREWELLYLMATHPRREQSARWLVMNQVVRDGGYGRSRFVIPFLGLALGHTAPSGSRAVGNAGMIQSFSPADNAVECLQRFTGQDFGYKQEGAAEERAAAIRRAAAWWEREGRAANTFERIERAAADRKP
ncbi:hypothetical protein J0H58_29185 [bacterium]|nr:hypothetical protein [bacterium]